MPRSPSLFWDITKAAAAAIQGLSLELTTKVFGQIAPSLTTGYNFETQQVSDLSFPCILLSLEGESEELLLGESEAVAYVWPLRLWIADSTPADRHDRAALYLGARKAIIDLFHQQTLAGRPEVVQCLVTPQIIFDPRLPAMQMMVSGMLLRFEAHESRY